jgi:F-type H+-transporting ATPase subunit gamma
MPSTRDIRRRIKSVKNTSQITKAMQLVAASKMKKAQDQAVAGRPYADLLNRVLVNLKRRADEASSDFFQEREGGRDLYLVVSTDKGLCGGLNTNLLRKVTQAAPADAAFVAIGRKGAQALSRMRRDLIADFPVADPAPFAGTKQASKFVTSQFLSGEFNRVFVAFTNFVNTLTQTPEVEQLLPLSPIQLGKVKAYEGVGEGSRPEDVSEEQSRVSYIFEPSAAGVLDAILPQYVNYSVYQMVLEARASEHSARMVAMKNATENANDIIKDLTLQYNKVRQAAITNELLEITTAMKALE